MEQSTKRSNIRYLIDLEVKVTAPDQPGMTCKVRDYCLSGMYLNAPGDSAEAPLRKGQRITIEFQGSGLRRQKIAAVIVNATTTGYGVKFEGLHDEALNALLAIATQQQSEKDEGLALAGAWQSEGRTGLHLLLKDSLQRHLITLFNSFHETIVDEIFERASRPRNTNEQNQMFEALDMFNTRRQESFLQVNNGINAGFDAFANGKPLPVNFGATASTHNANTLSLVNDKEFEDWLWASATVTQLESHYKEELYALNQRLSQLQGRPIDHENNPFAAPHICHTFQDLIRSFPIAEAPREIVITSFQGLVEKHFSALIDECNHHLISRGILPEVKREMQIKRFGTSTSHTVRKPSPIELVNQTAPSSIADTRHTTTQQQPAAVSNRQPAADLSGGASAGHHAASGLAHVRNLLRSMRSTDAPGGRGADSASATLPAGEPTSAATTSEHWYDVNELSSALSTIEGQLTTIRANRSKGESILSKLRESLTHIGGNPDKTIPAIQAESIEVIDNLMESVQIDPVISAQAQPWFEKLEVPLLKVAIKDESLIENSEHPATRFLNQLDMLGQSLSHQGGTRTENLRSEIDSLLEQVKDRSESDDPAFDQALNRLEDLHDSMRRQYEASVAEITSRCNGEYTIEAKRDELLRLLDNHYGGRMLPGIIFDIMDAGWKNLLLRSYVREGADGRIFRRFLEVLDQVIARLTGNFQSVNDAPWPESSLLELIPRGLRQVPATDDVIARLMAKMKPQFAMAAVEPTAIALKMMPKIGEITAEKHKRSLQERISRLHVSEERWNKADESVQSMSAGDMVTITDAHGNKQHHKLAWAAPNQSRYVFVDGEGLLSRDISRDDLTTLLLANNAAILEGWDVPLMDRATYSMLLSIHGKLLHQTNHDTLTGLYNRRTFDLELDKLVERTRIDKTKNILCYLDLDHFSLVNSMCSHDEGDRLLKETADILRRHAPEKAIIGRLGGDEFAMVLPDVSRTEGLMSVRKLQQAMNSHKFSCKTQSYRLSASFGLTEVTELSESSSRLMAAVDNACRIAKENGRDRIEIYHAENEDMTRRDGLIKLVGSIRDAINNNQLQLVCQRILPITTDNVKQAPYYEILLRVQGENGQPVSHADFIQAAEMYNRSIELDRWIATSVIDWLEQRLAAGKQLPIVSINLSGRSVNNKEFMDAIAARIIRSVIPRNHLCFEITETAAIGDMGQATHFINRIKRLGCSFSLDDFGTGLSSYSYLKALPVDYIKIDGSFVRNCHNEPRDLAVIKSINEIGHAMGKKTVAEFVENEEILKRLHEIGVDYAQGYGIEKPIPISQLD